MNLYRRIQLQQQLLLQKLIPTAADLATAECCSY